MAMVDFISPKPLPAEGNVFRLSSNLDVYLGAMSPARTSSYRQAGGLLCRTQSSHLKQNRGVVQGRHPSWLNGRLLLDDPPREFAPSPTRLASYGPHSPPDPAFSETAPRSSMEVASSAVDSEITPGPIRSRMRPI